MVRVSDDRALWLERFVLPHEAALRTLLARWRLPGDLDADDVIQEAYSRFAAMEVVDQIRNPRAYLFSVARTIVLMHLRHARVVSIRAVEDTDSQTIASDEPSPETQTSDREQLHILAIAVAGLPERGRRAFLLRTIDELSHREIGQRLGMSANAVQKSLAKSLLHLMATLGRGGNAGAEASKEHQQRETQKLHDRTRVERED